MTEADADLTRQHDGEPQGERIIVYGQVRRGRPAPGAQHAGRGLAGQRGRALPPRRRPAPRAAGPQLLRRRALPDRRRGALSLRHDQARRLPVGQPPQRVAPGAHPLLGLRARLRAAPGDADVLPRRPALLPGPDLQLGARPGGARAHDLPLRPRADAARVGAGLPVRHRPARAPTRRRWRRTTRWPPRRRRPSGPSSPSSCPTATGATSCPRARAGAVWLRGRVFDGDGAPVPDALVESWQADPGGAVRRRLPRLRALGHRRRGPLGHPDPQAGAGRRRAPTRPRRPPTSTSPSSPAGCCTRSSRACTSPTRRRPTPPIPCSPASTSRRARRSSPSAADDGYELDIHLQGPHETTFFAV